MTSSHVLVLVIGRLLSEFLGLQSMLAIVCKTYEGVKALETYDSEGLVSKGSGIHALGASIGRALEGRYSVICLENLRHNFLGLDSDT